MWEGSPYWNTCLGVSQFPDIIMHLMFLGVTNATQSLGQRQMYVVLKSKQFNLNIKAIFAPIRSMRIEWCKLIDIDAGWVLDNYLDFARIIKWFNYPLILV